MAEALKRHEAQSEAHSDFAALLETCVDAIRFGRWTSANDVPPLANRNPGTETVTGGDDDVHAGATSSAANLDARVCVLGGCVLAEIDERVAAYAPGYLRADAPDAKPWVRLRHCRRWNALCIDARRARAVPGLEPTLTFFKRWNVAAYFALRRREIVLGWTRRRRICSTRSTAARRRRRHGAQSGAAGRRLRDGGGGGDVAALEKCFDAERVFLPRAADKFVTRGADPGAVGGGSSRRGRRGPRRRPGAGRGSARGRDSASSGQADCERPESREPDGTYAVLEPPAPGQKHAFGRFLGRPVGRGSASTRGDVEVLAAAPRERRRSRRAAAALGADARRRGGGGGDGGFVRRRGGVDARARFGLIRATDDLLQNEHER